MSKKRGRDEDMAGVEDVLGPRSAKRKAMDVSAEEKAKKEAAAEKREVNKKLRGEVDDLAGLFGTMKAADQDGQGRRRRKRGTRKHKKAKKGKKTRKH